VYTAKIKMHDVDNKNSNHNKKSLAAVFFIIVLLGSIQILVLINRDNPDFFSKAQISLKALSQKIIFTSQDSKIEEDTKETVVPISATKEVVYFDEEDILDSENYFTVERNKLIEEKGLFVDVNLSEKIITVFDDGTIEYTLPIRAIASKTSWWQTPPGVYEAKNKIKTHKSSFGNVFMPWNIPFQGNFFIHGWPYYPSGNPATSSVSGGCIRLSTEDAETLFEDVPVNTPIIVHANEFRTDFIDKERLTSFPQLSTENYLVTNLDTNELYGKGNDLRELKLGNLALLPLTLSAAEYIGIEKTHIIPAIQDTNYIDDSERVQEGSRLRTYDLLFPALEDWSFESLSVFAKYLSKDRYIDVTNEKLASIGAHKSNIDDLAEDNPKNYTSPRDLFLLTKYIYLYRTFLLDISASKLNTYLYGEPLTNDRRESPRIFDSYSNFEGGIYDEKRGHVIANFSYTIEGIRQSIFIGVFESSNPLEDVIKIETVLKKTFEK